MTKYLKYQEVTDYINAAEVDAYDADNKAVEDALAGIMLGIKKLQVFILNGEASEYKAFALIDGFEVYNGEYAWIEIDNCGECTVGEYSLSENMWYTNSNNPGCFEGDRIIVHELLKKPEMKKKA